MSKTQIQADWDSPIIINAAVYEHGGACVPGRANRIVVAKGAGAYIDTMPNMAIFTLCNYMEHDVKLT